jgi:pyrroline-5-carboxylate reductase
MARVGLLGTGEIASAIVKTIAGDGHSILVSERSATISQELAQRHESVIRASNDDVVSGSDIILVCLLAEVARTELPRLPFHEGQSVISVIAGMSLKEIAGLCAPARDVAVAIPLPILPLGGTPLATYPASAALDALFAEHATIHRCASEEALSAHFAATGVLLPLLDQISLAATWLARFTNNLGAAEAYLAGLVGGYCRLLEDSPDLDLERLRRGLSTEGGLNQTLSAALAKNGTPEALEAGLDSLRPRLGLK